MKSNITSIINKINIEAIRQSDRRIEVTKTLLFFNYRIDKLLFT